MDSNNQKQSQEQYVNSREIMSYLSIRPRTLENLIKQGMPHIQITKQRRFKLTEVDNWLKRRMAERLNDI